jgi:hypothetical protein
VPVFLQQPSIRQCFPDEQGKVQIILIQIVCKDQCESRAGLIGFYFTNKHPFRFCRCDSEIAKTVVYLKSDQIDNFKLMLSGVRDLIVLLFKSRGLQLQLPP